MAGLYRDDRAAAARHTAAAAALRAGILDVLWDSSKVNFVVILLWYMILKMFQLAFYDYNLATNKRNTIFSAASFYPVWCGVIPDDILGSQEKAFRYFSSVNMVMNRYNGTYPATFIDTGLQWLATSYPLTLLFTSFLTGMAPTPGRHTNISFSRPFAISRRTSHLALYPLPARSSHLSTSSPRGNLVFASRSFQDNPSIRSTMPRPPARRPISTG